MDVVDVWDVRSIFNQRTSTAKRRRVAGSLYISEQGDEDDAGPGEQTWVTYLQQLRVCLYALALPGAAAVDPAPSERETPERSADFVQVPLDVLLKYWFRCEKLALQLPERLRLQHIQNLDRVERGEWAQRFANGTCTLGQCVLTVFRDRDARWMAPPPEPPAPPANRRGSPTEQPLAPADPNAGQFAKELRDGTRLCQHWQTGKCTKQHDVNCNNGKHKCAVTFRSGRVCGAPDHIGKNCRFLQKHTR